MDGVSSVDRDVSAANLEAEKIRLEQEMRRAEDARQEQARQAMASQPVVQTASDVLGVYVNITA